MRNKVFENTPVLDNSLVLENTQILETTPVLENTPVSKNTRVLEDNVLLIDPCLTGSASNFQYQLVEKKRLSYIFCWPDIENYLQQG